MNIPHYYHHFSPLKVNKYLKSGVILNKRVENILKEVVSDGESLYNVYETVNQYINSKVGDEELIASFNQYRAIRGSIVNNHED